MTPNSSPPDQDWSLAAKLLNGRFGHVSAWIFDLDNTLYPPDSGLWPAIEERITLFLIEHSGLDGASARALQRYYYRQHGTTLRGLVDEDNVLPADFLDFVHDIDRSGLPPNPALALEIARLPGRKLIFTNGSRDHALRTIEQLGLDGLFEDASTLSPRASSPSPPMPPTTHSCPVMASIRGTRRCSRTSPRISSCPGRAA